MAPSEPDPVTAEYLRLISLAVHEMRTPASVVGGYLRMLQTDASAPLSERHRRMVDEAEKSCLRLVALLAELSDVGKLDAGTAAVKTETFDVFELVRTVASEAPPVTDRQVYLETRAPADGGRMTGDLTRLHAALNVVVRAVMREQPSETTVIADAQRVSIDGRPTARLIVSPEPDPTLAAAAPPAALDDRRGGLGLGLPLARRVIARHGGSIWSPASEDGQEPPIGSRGAILVALPLSN
jgi:signal transduction histidine kinase